jgi:hypothetical protein
MTNVDPSKGFHQGMSPTVWGGPRVANLILGAWLFLSAFLWRHTPAARANTWIVGVLIIVFAVLSGARPQARYANTVLAVWLFLSSLSIYHVTGATAWNNCIVAILVFLFSLAPSSPTLRT